MPYVQDALFALFLFITLILSYYDIMYYRVPIVVVHVGIGLFFVGLIMCYKFNAILMVHFGLRILCAYYYVLAMRFISKKGMGVGDAHVSALSMALLNSFRAWFLALFSASLVALLYCLCLKRRKIYFVPFILCASATVYAGRKIFL